MSQHPFAPGVIEGYAPKRRALRSLLRWLAYTAALMLFSALAGYLVVVLS